MGLPCQGDDPTSYLRVKIDMTKKNKKYDLQHPGRGFLIAPITDNTMRFSTKTLSCKLLCKMRPTECTVGTVELAELYAEGVLINWSQFLLNELLEDATQAQEESKTKFHYSWLLILIYFIVWFDPSEYQPLDVPVLYQGMKYQNLWFDKEDRIR